MNHRKAIPAKGAMSRPTNAGGARRRQAALGGAPERRQLVVS
jgi:hypothetical protein